MRAGLKVAAVAAGLCTLLGATAEGCPGDAPPPSVGHDRDQPGVPDPPAPVPTPSQVVTLRFTVFTTTTAVVTWNAGHGNKFIDSMAPNGTRGESWTAGAVKGARIYLGAIPARRDLRGTISVKVENAVTGALLCHDTNYGNTRSGADCHAKAK